MVALAKVWSDSLNNLFSSDTDQAVQYREAAYFWKEVYVDAGWTVTLSTNGTNVPDATDQWTSPGVLLYGSGVQPRAWIVLRSPANWVVGAGLFNWIMIGLEHVNTDATPQTIAYRGSASEFSGGSQTAFPTPVITPWMFSAINMLAYPAPVRARWNAWWTADGDVYFGIKGDGVSCLSTFAFARSSGVLADTDGGRGIFRAVYGFLPTTQVTTNVLTWTTLTSSTNTRAHTQDGTAFTSGFPIAISVASSLSSWLAGAADVGQVPDAPVELASNSATIGLNRYFGQFVDVRGAPANAPFNELIDGDTDPVRLVNLLALWMPSSARLL